MGGVMAATGAVSGMPVAVAAPVSSAFLPGATKRSHRLGSRPVPARPRAPEPPGAPARARSRSLSPRLEVSLPRPLPGWPPWPPWPPTAGSGRAPASAAGTEQGSWGHPTRGWSPPSPSPPAPRAFTAPSCSIPFVRLRRRPIAPSSDPRSPQANGPVVSSWPDSSARRGPGAGGLRRLRCPSAVVTSPPRCPYVLVAHGGQGSEHAAWWPCGRRPSPAQNRDFPQGERLNRSFQGFGI